MSDRPRARVLLLSDYGGSYGGSFVPMLRAIAAEAGARGIVAACGFTPVARGRDWVRDLEADGLEVRFAPATGRGTLRDWIAAWLAELDEPVVIHTHFTGFELPAVAAADGAPVLWHIHSHLPSSPGLLARGVAKFTWFGRRVAGIVCVSEALAKAVRHRGAPRSKIVVVRNGVDTARFGLVDTAERDRARAELGLPADAPVWMHVGWDWEAKGGPLFTAALSRMRAAGSRAVGLSVGGGSAARAAAVALDLPLAVVEPDADVRRFYAAADALAASSAGEGAPFAILEALSCGRAVVATDVPGHRLSPRPPAAFRLAPATPDGFALAARETLERAPEAARREAAEAHDWVVANRALELTASRVADLYEVALGG